MKHSDRAFCTSVSSDAVSVCVCLAMNSWHRHDLTLIRIGFEFRIGLAQRHNLCRGVRVVAYARKQKSVCFRSCFHRRLTKQTKLTQLERNHSSGSLVPFVGCRSRCRVARRRTTAPHVVAGCCARTRLVYRARDAGAMRVRARDVFRGGQRDIITSTF